jgi:hypothetical protein
MFDRIFKKARPRLEEQLRDLASCGVRLLPSATPEVLLEEWSREQFEERPYELALIALGHEDEPRASNLWHFDTERIEDHGAYRTIAERFRGLADGDLPLSDVEDFVDVQAGKAWLAFTIDGVAVRWTCEVDGDWVDSTVLTRFADLVAKRRTGRRFTYLDLGGQDCLLGYFSEAEKAQLARVTKLPWQWLT